ncbi:MAG: InlB B-repeat-containing protein [Bacteroidales bacterium]|nr:InlB B-repeat-containing protein [Bacteroidales bacterium]
MCGCKKNETFTVTFDANGGTGTMEPQTVKYGETFTLTKNAFTRENYVFVSWNTVPDGNGISYDDGHTFIAVSDMTLYAQWASNGTNPTPGPDPTPTPTTGTLNGHDWVDLGLPSGTKWATCNVGADTPEGYGNYYAWGETTTKETYSSSTYSYSNDGKLTKYCNNAECGNDGFTDALTILEASDDAAIANWGAGWRMPTYDEMVELINNCTVTWTIQNGVNGGLFSGPNGNSIFMPAAGYSNGSSPYATGPFGSYWSSSLYTDFPYHALILYFTADGCCVSDRYRFWGFSVRPVLIENN